MFACQISILSIMSLLEENSVSTFPPTICNNPREKIAPEQIDPNSLLALKTFDELSSETQAVPYPSPEGPLPCPQYPLKIIWSPERLYFELNDKPVIRKLWIWNGSERIIYIHCCGLWNETARLGASWRTYPRTRLHLAPGLKTELFVKATPKNRSPVPSALIGLQLAASHKRDNVVGYFCVPVVAKFLNHEVSSLGGEE